MSGAFPGAIPWTAIITWCDWHSHVLDRVSAMQLIHVIRSLDNDFAEREASKRALAAAGVSR